MAIRSFKTHNILNLRIDGAYARSTQRGIKENIRVLWLFAHLKPTTYLIQII